MLVSILRPSPEVEFVRLLCPCHEGVVAPGGYLVLVFNYPFEMPAGSKAQVLSASSSALKNVLGPVEQ